MRRGRGSSSGDRQRGIVWFRRDLRLADNRTLRCALDECDEIVPLFVVDDRLWNGASDNRRWFLAGCLADLDEQLDHHLIVRRGDPIEVIAALMEEHRIARLYRAADASPYGRRRDAEVDDAVHGGDGETVVVDQPYAAPLDGIRTGQGEPFKVFTAYWRRWLTLEHGTPLHKPRAIPTVPAVDGDGLPDGGRPSATAWYPEPGERAGRAAVDRFLSSAIDAYADRRDSPGDDSTSRLGPYLKFGCIHPRQILPRLDMRLESHRTFASELAWRDFYASVLHAWPDSAWSAWSPVMSSIELDTGASANRRFDAWCQGRTGYPLVDAGMRQLVAEGFMHNRVRMVTASFLVKDLHIDWTRGARFFLDHLYDGDLPSNNHGWQWVAGTGTDAAPYFRVFNPVRQSQRFDPDGVYIRRWVSELATIDVKYVHAPWTAPDGPPADYPGPMVDHATERVEALRRLAALG